MLPLETSLNLCARPLLIPNYRQEMALCISKHPAYKSTGFQGKNHCGDGKWEKMFVREKILNS